MAGYLYTGDKRREILFPLGGIGSGCVSIDGTGRLRDWEIFNRPNKGSYNGYTHFAIKAERGGQTLDARVLNADLMPPYTGRPMPGAMFSEYGFGPSRYLMSGVPHFKDSEFTGRFPFAKVRFMDPSFPGEATLKAFNPFIPLDDANSSIPAAFFELSVKNTTDEVIEYTGALSINNPMTDHRQNLPATAVKGLVLTGSTEDRQSPAYGQMAAAALGDVHVQQYWFRGGWFDNLSVFWQDFTAPGPMKNRVYPPSENKKGLTGEDIGSVLVRASVAPGQTERMRFIITWYYPNCENYWSPCREGECGPKQKTWKNYYASLFNGAEEAAAYGLNAWDELAERSRAFSDALLSSTLPDTALEAVSSNLAVLKSPTCLRLEDGSFYGFEGCHCSCGSCEGSCTHVWNYAFALPFLFPKLERSMRELDYTYNLRDDGGMPFRLQLPLGRQRSSFRPCVDGQMGGVIKTYREWKISGDTAWLSRWWPKVKQSLAFAWSKTNSDRWDPEKTGVITGRQHHTLDMELFGPNAWLNAFYLGALKAGAEMARAVGDEGSAIEYEALFARGKAFTDSELYNGEYYIQKVDIRDESLLDPYRSNDTLHGSDTYETYWNPEARQIKYQIAEGCSIDQVLAQWMCDLSGLGDILDPEQVKSALESIARYNFKASFRDHFNPCRIYGLNDEAGLVICEWPDGREKPVVPIPYAEESMHGFEYQAACHMIGRGLEEEGLRAVKAIRDRYDGEKRNPYNEFECGSNYARSMASYALLLTYSGFHVDQTRSRIAFMPLRDLALHRYFFSIEGGWGVFEMDRSCVRIRLIEGALTVSVLEAPGLQNTSRVEVAGRMVGFTSSENALRFEAPLTIRASETITIQRECAGA